MCSEGLSGTCTFHIIHIRRQQRFMARLHASDNGDHPHFSNVLMLESKRYLSTVLRCSQHLQHFSRSLRSFEGKGHRMAQAKSNTHGRQVEASDWGVTQTGPKCQKVTTQYYTYYTNPNNKEVDFSDLQVYIVWLSVERSASYLLRPGQCMFGSVSSNRNLGIIILQYHVRKHQSADLSLGFICALNASPRPHDGIQGFLPCCSWSSWAF